MAGHAPEFLSPGKRLQRWLDESSDVRLSVYMLITAAVIGLLLLVLDRSILP
ncbi:MAG: hypothetical protein ABII12_04990 [Planctomycetota bacterium]